MKFFSKYNLVGVAFKTFLLLVLILPAAAQRKSPAGKATAQKTSAAQTALNANAQNALDAAVAALQAEALAEAETKAREAVKFAPQSPVTHNVLGVILDKSGKIKEAAAAFQTAIKLDAKFISPRNNLARLLAQTGKKQEAIAQFETLLKIAPDYLQARYNLGTLYADAGNFEKSADNFSSALSQAPNDPQLALAFLNVAYRAKRENEANAAADLVERAAQNDVRDFSRWASLWRKTINTNAPPAFFPKPTNYSRKLLKFFTISAFRFTTLIKTTKR